MADTLTAAPGSTSAPVPTSTTAPPAPPAAEAFAGAEPSLLAPVYHLPRLALASGRGARVVDTQGREYLDFVSGIAVNALGHAPSGLASAVARQMKKLGHCSNLFANEPAIALARSLCEATGYARAFFCNSGTEGIEAALKFARARAGAKGMPGRDIVAFRGGFHGRTGFAVSATWTPSYREPFEPLIPGVRFSDFNDVAGLDAAIDAQVAAVIVEPVQGEGGAVAAQHKFLQAVRQRTSATGATLILDEVQCGMGRCGHLLAAQHYGVQGDLTVLSKALGGGFPLAAVLMTAEVAETLTPGMHGCTFGGNPVAATAGNWVLARVNRKGFLARVRKRGKELGAGLEALAKKHASLGEVLGLGLLRGIEIAPGAPFDPAGLVKAAMARDLLLVKGGERAVRLLPPLTVSPEEIVEALARLDAALGDLAAAPGAAS
ncbi:MAG: aspartate aminotransferase family protein [Candidatus Eiseniibacteriota bacterium]